MGFLRTLIGWGRDAWGAVTGGAADVAGALGKLWHYITSVHNLLSWLAGVPVLDLVSGLTGFATEVERAYVDLYKALARIAVWILNHLIMPWVKKLLALIAALDARERADVKRLIADDIEGLRLAEAYTDRQVTTERIARIKDVAAARAYALALTRALHKTIETEAVSGYTADYHARLGLIGTIADQLAGHDPAVSGLVKLLAKTALDLAAVDDPAARFALGFLITHVVDRLGVDKVVGDLLSALLGPLTGQGKPTGVHDVVRDVSQRLNALEGQWAEFMANGGADVEQAGRLWHSLTSPAADAVILGFFGFAAADPSGWATAIQDSFGRVAEDTLTAAAHLIERA